MREVRFCSIDYCNEKHWGKTYCKKHYHRLRKGKDPAMNTRFDLRPSIICGSIAKVPLGIDAKQGYAIIDNYMAPLIDKYKWCLSNQGYATHTLPDTKRLQIYYLIVKDRTSEGFIIDHVNGDKLDNRRENLRYATYQQNNVNVSSRKGAFSKYKGVYWSPRYRKWQVVLNYNKKCIYIGRFHDEVEAARAYDKKAIELHGEFARLNIKGEEK